MTQLEKVVYTGKARTVGGREGSARSDDGRLELKLSRPGTGEGTNPEQMFAAGYAACFTGALGAAATRLKVQLPKDVAIDSEVDLGPIPGNAFGIAVRMKVHLPGIDAATGRQLLDTAHQICPYSNATRGNIDVKIDLA